MSALIVIGALLGTQNGREVEIVNSFELAMDDEDANKVDHGFLTSRKEQCEFSVIVLLPRPHVCVFIDKQVFPSLELIGWYTVAQVPTSRHIFIHEQVRYYDNSFLLLLIIFPKFVPYTTNPILLVLQPHGSSVKADISGHALPFKAYEPTVEIKDRTSRVVFVEASFVVETGEVERIAVDWSAKGGEGGTSRKSFVCAYISITSLTYPGLVESHLQTQRAAVKMLHDRIFILVQYVTEVLAGSAKKDHTVLRSLSALIASLPATEHPNFREEFDKVNRAPLSV